MNLAIFDIDGTLTATNQVDIDCFVQAFDDLYSIVIDNTDWNTYTTYSDSGISAEIFHRQFGRFPEKQEWRQLIGHFVTLLKTAHKSNPQQFMEVAGASEMLRRLKKDKKWALAIATGCWEASALLKLDFARLDCKELPLAHSDKIFAREDIIQDAIEQAKKQQQNNSFEKIVYIGDGKWDVRATRNIGLNFIGISNHKDPKYLYDEGAALVLRNYLDYTQFLDALHSACVPK